MHPLMVLAARIGARDLYDERMGSDQNRSFASDAHGTVSNVLPCESACPLGLTVLTNKEGADRDIAPLSHHVPRRDCHSPIIRCCAEDHDGPCTALRHYNHLMTLFVAPGSALLALAPISLLAVGCTCRCCLLRLRRNGAFIMHSRRAGHAA